MCSPVRKKYSSFLCIRVQILLGACLLLACEASMIVGQDDASTGKDAAFAVPPDWTPFGFYWAEEGVISGMGYPGYGAGASNTYAYLLAQGVTHLLSLTVTAPELSLVSDAGLEQTHIPVTDMQPPTMAQLGEFVLLVETVRDEGGAITVHCNAGRGRTGTFLAVWLVHRGMSAAQAIDAIRTLRPGSIETIAQEAVVVEFWTQLSETR